MRPEARLSIGLALTLAVAAALAGCFRQKVELSVHANRAGKLHVWRSTLDAGEEDGEPSSLRHRALLNELACWEGVVAWTRDRVEARDGKTGVAADAYFEDVNALVRSEAGVGRQELRMAELDADVLDLEWTFRPAKPWIEGDIDTWRSLVATLGGVEISGEVTMPSRILSARGANGRSGRSASWTLLSASQLESEIVDLQARVARGELTREKATAALHASYEQRKATFLCEAVENEVEIARFKEELEAAKKTYRDGTLRKEVEELRKKRAGGEPAAASASSGRP